MSKLRPRTVAWRTASKVSGARRPAIEIMIMAVTARNRASCSGKESIPPRLLIFWDIILTFVADAIRM